MLVKVAAFGEVMMRCSVPGKKKLFQSNNLEYMFSGTGLNVMGQLGRFGLETELITKLPDNPLGDAAVSQIQSLGVNTGKRARGGEFIGIYFLEEGFGKRPSVVTYTDRRGSSFCKSKLKDYNMEDILENVQMIHFCGISLAMNDDVRNIMFSMAKRAKEKGILVVFDCNYREKLWKKKYEDAIPNYKKIIEYSDIVFASEKDISNIFGIKSEKENVEIEEILRDLIPEFAAKYDLKLVSGTIRDNKSLNSQKLKGFAYKNKKIYFSEYQELEIYDRIGGGDAYTSGILYKYLKKAKLEEMVDFAVASAVLGHTTYGDTPVSALEEVEELLHGDFSELKR